MKQLTYEPQEEGDDLVAQLERLSAGHLPGLLGMYPRERPGPRAA